MWYWNNLDWENGRKTINDPRPSDDYKITKIITQTVHYSYCLYNGITSFNGSISDQVIIKLLFKIWID